MNTAVLDFFDFLIVDEDVYDFKACVQSNIGVCPRYAAAEYLETHTVFEMSLFLFQLF
jgi:hypothetical protein